VRDDQKERDRHHSYYLEHRDAVLARTRAWALAHPEKRRESVSKYDNAHLDERRARRKNYYAGHREMLLEKAKAYARLYAPGHQEQIKKNIQKFHASNPEKRREYRRRWTAANPEKLRAKRKRYSLRHPEKMIMTNAIHRLLDGVGVKKSSRGKVYVGCTPGFLRNHLEEQFKPGMTWDNYGDWEVDHIIPISLFPVKEMPELLMVASHWTNLQPMWAKENHQKGNRISE